MRRGLLHPARAPLPGARQLDLARTLARLKPWFESDRHRKVGQNAKYDRHVLANHGIDVRGVVHDTLMPPTCWKATSATTWIRSHAPPGRDDDPYEDVAGKGASSICFDQVSVESATEYSAEDADVTFQLHGALATDRGGREVEAHLRRHRGAGVQRTPAMERNGVLIDAALLATQGGELGAKMRSSRGRRTSCRQPFNLASPKQLGEISSAAQAPAGEKDALGSALHGRGVLEKLASTTPAQGAARAPGLAKLKSTYTDKRRAW